MKNATRRLKTLLLGFMQSPLKILAEISRRLFPGGRGESQILRLRKAVQETPLILQIETINVCNAACVFCAYPSMKRKNGVMSMALFAKIVDDYAEMGGGPVSLTPVVGDALLDPHFLERLAMLEARREINQVSLTTNAIALERYSDEDVCRILQVLDCIQISIGGLDAATYHALYGVDKFSKVQHSMERLLRLKGTISDPANITFAFRTNDWTFEVRFKPQLDEYRRQGVFISHIWTYANYSGVIRSDSKLNLDVMESSTKCCKKSETCIYASVHMAICWDGRITACGCADFEGNSLWIGKADQDSLAAVWLGEKRARILDSFKNGRLVPICLQCTAYQTDRLFAQPFCKDVEPRQPLPLEYFHNFWGG